MSTSELHAITVAKLTQLPIVQQAFSRLDNELPEDLHYHSAQHTRDVFAEALRFAVEDGLGERELLLIAVAAAYHDLGYLERYEKNEPVGADLAERAMRDAGGFTELEITEVREMILSTQVTDTPTGLERTKRTELAAYLMDADWGSFGRDDFFEKCDQLIEETRAPAEAFYQKSLQLVGGHKYLTAGARALRDAAKQENLEELRRRLHGSAE